MSPRILVVEDAADLRDIIEMTLQFRGFDVVSAANGREALDILEKNGPVDLAISDLDMPVMNGLEFIRQCRAGKAPSLPILVLTAETREIVSEAMAAGASGSITKPFEPIALLETVEKALT